MHCVGKESEPMDEAGKIVSVKDLKAGLEGGIMEIHSPLEESHLKFEKQKKRKKKKRYEEKVSEEGGTIDIHAPLEESHLKSEKQKKRKKKKRSKEKVREAVIDNSTHCIANQSEVRAEIGSVDSLRNIQAEMERALVEINAPLKESSVSSTSSKNNSTSRKRKFKLATTSDLNSLLSNPEEDASCNNNLYISKISQPMEEPMDEYILPDPCVSSMAVYSNSNLPLSGSFFQEGNGMEPNISDVIEQEQEQIDNVAMTTSASWHLPVTPENSLQIKSIARAAVKEVMSDTSGHGSLEGDSSGLKSRKRRTLSHYELLCKTTPTDLHTVVNEDSKSVEYFENENSGSSEPRGPKIDSKVSIEGSDPLAKKTVTIKDLYRTPKRKKVPAVLYDACKFIFSQNVEVSALNIAYTGHCVPGEREYRRFLRKKYKAKFGRYHDEQDSMLLQRFDTLVQHGVVEDKVEFYNFLNIHCNGKDQKELMKSKRSIGVRNIVGLYVGQDMPRKIAAVHCLRLISLVLGSSYLFPGQETAISTDVSRLQVEQTEDEVPEDVAGVNVVANRDVEPVKKRIVRKWSKDEDMFLIEEVTARGTTRVENVDPMTVDWEGVAQGLDRKVRCVAEHWSRVVQPILVEETDPNSIISYRRKLLKEVLKMGAGHRKEIEWDGLAKKFHPRSTYAIQMNFSDLVRGGRSSSTTDSSQEFRDRVTEALAKVNRVAGLPEKTIGKFIKRTPYKEELREYYWDLVN